MVRAVIFDFNGTLSDDEPLIEDLFREVLAEQGVLDLTPDLYRRELAGISDPDIARRALELGGHEPAPARVDAILRAKVERYRAATTASPRIAAAVVEAVRWTAQRVPVAVASGALREEIEHGLALAGLRDAFAAVVTIDDVAAGKPDPAGFLRALECLNAATGAPPVAPADTLVVEDSNAGVAAGRAAGMRVAALRNPALTSTAADVVVDALDQATMARLLGP